MPNATGLINSISPPAGTPFTPGQKVTFTANATVSVDPASPSNYNFQLAISSREAGKISPPTLVLPGQTIPIATSLDLVVQSPSAEVGCEIIAAAAPSGMTHDMGEQDNHYPVS